MKQLMLSSMVQVETLPSGQSFVAIWRTASGLFSAAFNYNEDEDQFYVYESECDDFIPECDHGYTLQFFRKMQGQMLFFVEGCEE